MILSLPSLSLSLSLSARLYVLIGSGADSVEELQNFSLEESGCVRTDFAAGADCYQKVVRFCRDGSKLVTGGMERVVRVWRVSLSVCPVWGGGGGGRCEMNLKLHLIY